MFTHINTFERPQLERFLVNGKRWYRDDSGLVQYPSITTILDSNKPKSLKEWQASVGLDKAAKMAKKAADRGSACHDLIERYIHNEEINLDHETVVQSLLFKQFKLAGNSNKLNNIVGLEFPLYSHDIGASGTTDCIAEYEGVPSIIDFKTSNNYKSRDMIGNYFLQTTAYAIMFNEMYNQSIEQIVIIMMVESGFQPAIYKDKIDNHVQPLLETIDRFYAQEQLSL